MSDPVNELAQQLRAVVRDACKAGAGADEALAALGLATGVVFGAAAVGADVEQINGYLEILFISLQEGVDAMAESLGAKISVQFQTEGVVTPAKQAAGGVH